MRIRALAVAAAMLVACATACALLSPVDEHSAAFDGGGPAGQDSATDTAAELGDRDGETTGDAGGDVGPHVLPLPDAGRYSNCVLEAGPLLYWRFEEGSGDPTVDWTGNGRTAGKLDISRRPSFDGGANSASFDSVGATISMDASAAVAFAGRAAFTIEMWLYAEASNVARGILGRGTTSDGPLAGGYLLYADSHRLHFQRRSPDGVEGVASTLIDPDGGVVFDTWHHVVVTYDDSRLKLWIDAKNKGSRNLTGSLPVVDAPLILGNVRGYAQFRGRVDDVAIYAHALSDPTIRQHANACRP